MKKKVNISQPSLTRLWGVCLVLFALVILFSPNTALTFLSKGILFVFGFVGYWLLTPFLIILGIYLIFKKSFLKLKVKSRLWGLFLIIVGLLVFLSAFTENLLFQNAYETFSEVFKNHEPVNTKLAGGFFGFVVAGALNSGVTYVGTRIIFGIFIFVGFVFLFLKEFKKLFMFIHNKIEEKTHKDSPKAKAENTTLIQENEQISVQKIEEEKPDEKPQFNEEISKPTFDSFESFTRIDNNRTSEFHRARLDFDEAPAEDKIIQRKVVDFDEEPQKSIIEPEPITESVYKETSVVDEEVVEPVNETTNFDDFNNDCFEGNQDVQYEEPKPTTPVAPVPQVQPQPIKPQETDPLHRPQPKANLVKNYSYPSIDLLDLHEQNIDFEAVEQACLETESIINQTFVDFRIGAQVIGHTVGPSVTRYDVKPNANVSVNVISKILNDLSVRLRGVGVRYEPIVPGKSTSGLEIANKTRSTVGLRESINQMPTGEKSLRNIPFGKDISGDLVCASVSEFPHMLVSGTTGSGKTIFVHSMIVSLIMRNKPEQLKIVLIDPKKVEMTFYEDIPHLLCPIISDANKANVAMKKLVDEMERRYNLFQASRTRDIKSFNEKANLDGIQPLPYICVFIDEYADLFDQVKEIRDSIVRLAQKARACGIHLIVATQRPSVNVIDGVIKGNIPTRVALLSASYTDSCTIIGEGGAEKLLGNGDMLVDSALLSTTGKPRVQGCFVSVDEINRVCDFLRNNYPPEYDPYFLNLVEKPQEPSGSDASVKAIDKSLSDEAQYQEIKEQICAREFCSISYIQRTFGMGFPRAGKIFNRLVSEGIVAEGGDARGSKVLVHQAAEQQMGTVEQSTYIPDSGNENGNQGY